MARHHLLLGLQDLRAATVKFNPHVLLVEPAARQSTRAALVRARQEFADARLDLSLWAPALARLGWAPRVGEQLAAAPPAADAAFYSTRSALQLIDGLSLVGPTVERPGRGALLSRLISPLQAAGVHFTAARLDADRAIQALNRLPEHSANATLDTARTQLRTTLPELRTASAWLAAAPAILGAHTASHYLIVVQDPAELRATGGFIGAADFVTVRHGSVETLFTSSDLPREIASAPPPFPEALYTAEGFWTFRDANWSPDFPLSARIERWFYGEDTGRWSEGVISIVDSAITGILAATGPVFVPAFHRWVGAGNIAALSKQYVNGSYHGPSITDTPDTVRKQFFGYVITALFQRVQSLPADRWPSLGTALMAASSRRDLMLFDRRSAVESAIRMAGLDGRLAPGSEDFLYIVDDNRSYNKVNPYVREWADYRATIFPNLWLDATLTLHYYLRPSPANLEGFGPVFGLWGSKHDYQDFLRVYVPAGAHLERMSGLDRWAPAPAYGLTQFAGRLLLRQGQTRMVSVRYAIPANVFVATQFKRYGLSVRRQPGSMLSSIRVTIRGAGGIRLTTGRWLESQIDRRLPLDTDAHLSLALQGIARPEVKTPPQPRAPFDPYIPFGYLRDPRHAL
jgi:hypothetical protein